MRVTRAIVLVIDRLGASWLGPYGNTWLETPNFNRLAAESVLVETAIAESPDLTVNYESFWTGRHALPVQASADARLSAIAAEAGSFSVLLSDDRVVAEHPLAASFSERTALTPVNNQNNATEVEQTEMFAFFAAARALVEQTVEQSASAELLWLHSRGMSGPWDAPLELRYQFADEEDPEPPTFVEPPTGVLAAGFDPDELLGYGQAYAGQVALADMCLGLLLDALDEHPLRDKTMLIVTSGRGYPLGEHRRLGGAEPALYSELLHVPLLIRAPGVEPARLPQILQPSQLANLIYMQGHWRASIDSGRFEEGFASGRGQVAYAIAPGERAIRTPAWFLRQTTRRDGDVQNELFAKPDDRWEANEISSRCTEAVELLAGELARFEAAQASNALTETPPLAELLCDIWR